MSLDYRPLCYMWIAEFEDGTAAAQFDPDTGKENKADPDWLPSAEGQPPIPKAQIWKEKRIVRFGWYPFSVQLAQKILEAQNIVVIPTNNPVHVLELKKGDQPVAYRTNSVKLNLGGGVSRGETVYMLGKAGAKILGIHEDGSVE